jgi:hypothetical protein
LEINKKLALVLGYKDKDVIVADIRTILIPYVEFKKKQISLTYLCVLSKEEDKKV